MAFFSKPTTPSAPTEAPKPPPKQELLPKGHTNPPMVTPEGTVNALKGEPPAPPSEELIPAPTPGPTLYDKEQLNELRLRIVTHGNDSVSEEELAIAVQSMAARDHAKAQILPNKTKKAGGTKRKRAAPAVDLGDLLTQEL